MTAPTPPQHPCPHGCGALLSVSTRTQPGEIARCPTCGRHSTYYAGLLIIAPTVSLRSKP